MITKSDKKIISLISQDISLSREPFGDLAKKLGVNVNYLLSRIKYYKQSGILRKFSASLNHLKVGFAFNAMAVWDIPEGLMARAGKLISTFSEVSHCYQRKKDRDWKYNLYAMVHGRTKKECLNAVARISKKIKCVNSRVLFSSEEYKKTGAKY